MKKVLFWLCSALFLVGCTNPSGEASGIGSTHQEVYERAVKAKDDYTAIVALNYMLAKDSSNMEYSDSLARLYLRNGVFAAGIRLGEKILGKQKGNDGLLELVAEAQGITGDYTNAVKKYNSLFEKNHNLVYLFQLAKIESNRNAPEAFLQRLNQILSDSGSALVEMPSVQGSQMIDIKAAANYLKGQLYYNTGNVEMATEFMKKALGISPDFVAAQVAVEQIKEMSRAGAQGQSGAPRKLSKAELEQLNYERYLQQQGGR